MGTHGKGTTTDKVDTLLSAVRRHSGNADTQRALNCCAAIVTLVERLEQDLATAKTRRETAERRLALHYEQARGAAASFPVMGMAAVQTTDVPKGLTCTNPHHDAARGRAAGGVHHLRLRVERRPGPRPDMRRGAGSQVEL